MGVEHIEEKPEFYYTILWSIATHFCFRGPLLFHYTSPVLPHILYFFLQFFWSMASINAFTNPCYWIGYATMTNFRPSAKLNSNPKGPQKVPEDRLLRFIGINLAGHICGDIIFSIFMLLTARYPFTFSYLAIEKPGLPSGLHSFTSGFIGELLQTFVVIFCSFYLSYISTYPPLSSALIGSSIGSILILVGTHWTGCHVNPAAVLAHSFVSIGIFWSWYDIKLIWFIYIAGPILGSMIAGAVVSHMLNASDSSIKRSESKKDL